MSPGLCRPWTTFKSPGIKLGRLHMASRNTTESTEFMAGHGPHSTACQVNSTRSNRFWSGLKASPTQCNVGLDCLLMAHLYKPGCISAVPPCWASWPDEPSFSGCSSQQVLSITVTQNDTSAHRPDKPETSPHWDGFGLVLDLRAST